MFIAACSGPPARVGLLSRLAIAHELPSSVERKA
jgi:hypothetical protein